ncbi:MAG: DUF952 domain-containing protein [Spirochaetales bacterium]|nr:DUF952 domain-containing protein [Spirochaetales bacterium]
MIYHLVNKSKWSKFKLAAFYTTNSLEREGYIHCSFEHQILKVANMFHHGETDLLILCIDSKKIESILKVEDLFGLNENYPHIYGQLPINAIEKVLEFKVDSNGYFILPDLNPISELTVKHKEWT